MSKLNQEELLDECISAFNSELAKINYQKSFHRDDSFLSGKWEKINQAKEQIMALIKKPEVTEEWINGKAFLLQGAADNFVALRQSLTKMLKEAGVEISS